MAEQSVPVMEPAQAPAVTEQPIQPPKTTKKKKKKRKWIKNLIVTLVVLAVLAAAAYAIWYFVFAEREETGLGEPIFDQAYRGSVVSMVSGYGTANAKDSASIVLTQSGTVEEVYVSQGQMVYEGDPLYVISSEEAEKALQTALDACALQEENMAKLQGEYDDLLKSRGELTIAAPHAGKLTDVSDLKVGDPLMAGTAIARVVDDTRLKLSLYYSYAYEHDIYVGQSAVISVPATMTDLAGRVEKINKVRMITPEGGVNFEVVFVVNNPGTMTEGMAASASLTDSAGNPIYPYESGAFRYYQTTTIATKADGEVERLADLMNYADVTAGQILLVQGTTNVDEKLRNKQEQIDAALKSLEEAQKRAESERKNLENFSAVSPITGMVVAMNLFVGGEVTAGSTAITIADNSVMTVNISVDDRNRQYIETGMELELRDWYGNFYIGVVDSLAVIGENQNGVTVYPGVVRVDNPGGTLMGGYGLDYSFAAAQSLDCIVIPKGDLRYYSAEGLEEPQAVVFVRTDEQRENRVEKNELPADMQKEIPKGCVVLAVETGLTDNDSVEILSGLQEGDEVYNSTPKADGNYSSWG